MVELLWWSDADEAMGRLEADATAARALTAVKRTLGRLELDSSDPRLGTRQFRTSGYGHIRATPCRFENWYLLWQEGTAAGTLEIVMVAELTF